MTDAVRLSTTEITFTAANTVYNSTLVRVFAPALSLVTVRNAATTVLGTMTIPANGVEYIKKQPTDTIGGSTTLNCTVGSY